MQESGSLELSRVALVSHAMRFCLVWTRFVLPRACGFRSGLLTAFRGDQGTLAHGTPWITANFTHQTTFFFKSRFLFSVCFWATKSIIFHIKHIIYFRSFLVQCLFLSNQVSFPVVVTNGGSVHYHEVSSVLSFPQRPPVNTFWDVWNLSSHAKISNNYVVRIFFKDYSCITSKTCWVPDRSWQHILFKSKLQIPNYTCPGQLNWDRCLPHAAQSVSFPSPGMTQPISRGNLPFYEQITLLTAIFRINYCKKERTFFLVLFCLR